MRKLTMTIAIGALALTLAGCQKKEEAAAPAAEAPAAEAAAAPAASAAAAETRTEGEKSADGEPRTDSDKR
jgi:PBP1b-binding outer membrane lipoprotein LpoB